MRYLRNFAIALSLAFSLACRGGVQKKLLGCYSVLTPDGDQEFCYDNRQRPHRTFSDFFEGSGPDGALDLYCVDTSLNENVSDFKCTSIFDKTAKTNTRVAKSSEVRMRESKDAYDAQTEFDAVKSAAKVKAR